MSLLRFKVNSLNLNTRLLSRLKEKNIRQRKHIIQKLKDSFPFEETKSLSLSLHPDNYTEFLEKMFDEVISLRQSRVSKDGSWFEKQISEILRENNISFKEQVNINKHGIIVKERKNIKRVDFVIPSPEIGTHISEYIVLSCKTSSKERQAQDDWFKSLHTKPFKFIFLTLADDYPSPVKFCESSNRKIITTCPKQNDTRIYKLDFNHLISEIHTR